MKKTQIIKSLLWKLTERMGVQLIGIVISVLLARFLLPSDYGIVSITTVFINISNILIQSGLSSSVLQKKHPDSLDYSTALWSSLGVSFFLYIIIFVSSPEIAVFFSMADLTKVLRIIGIKLIFDGIYSIQNAYASKNLLYRKIFISSIFASGMSGAVGIVLAIRGGGAWALVAQQIVFSIVNCFMMYFQLKNVFMFRFSLDRLKKMMTFGTEIMASDLLDSLFLNIRSLLIGRFYSASSLGNFTQGRQLPTKIMTNLNGSIQSIMMVAYSDKQDNTIILKRMVRRSMSISSFLVFPMMIGLAVIAEPLVNVLLTEKWSGSIVYIRIAALTFMWMPIHTANIQVIKAMGKSTIILKMQIIRKAIEVVILVFSLRLGVVAIALGELLSTLFSFAINLYPNKKLINYGPKEQFKDIIPSLTASVIMGVIINQIPKFIASNIMILVAQILLGFIIYIIISFIFRIDDLQYLFQGAKELWNSNIKT